MPLVGIGTLPTPFSPASVPLPPQKQGGGGTLACGWGVEGSPNSDEGHTLWYSLYVRTLCAAASQCHFLAAIFRGEKNTGFFQIKVKMEGYVCLSLQTECQAFSPVVRIGTHQPLTRRRVCPTVFFGGGDTLACGRGDGTGIPIRTRRQSLWFSRYTVCTLWPKCFRIESNQLKEGLTYLLQRI